MTRATEWGVAELPDAGYIPGTATNVGKPGPDVTESPTHFCAALRVLVRTAEGLSPFFLGGGT